MSPRETILESLRRVVVPSSPLPDSPEGVTYLHPDWQFGETLVLAGGRLVRLARVEEFDAEVLEFGALAEAKKIVSLVRGAGASTVDLEAVTDPHQLDGIDVAIIPGQFGVAENAAVWVPQSLLGPHRAIFVIAQHLVLVVPADQIVHNMREAYERIQLERSGFGVFISGPSKTADIEQSLVIGAQGPRTCTVVLLEEAAEGVTGPAAV